MAFDLRARFFSGSVRGDGKIALIYLDQYSLDWAEKELDVTWPWPREMYGLVTEFCSRARSTSFDVLFPGPSSYGVDDDRAFAAAIRKADNVVLSEMPEVTTDQASDGSVSPLSERKAHGALPAPELAQTGAPVGSVTLKPDRDGVFRHYRPFADSTDRLHPSLGLAALAGKNPVGYDAGTGLVTVGARDGSGAVFKLDAKTGAVPRFGLREKVFRRYNAAEVIASAISLRAGSKPQLDPAVFEGSFVFFGFSAPGLYDRQATPVSASGPGVDVHAFFLRSLLDSSFLKRLPAWLDHLVAAAAGLALGLLFSRARSRLSQSLVAIAGLLMVPAAGFLAYSGGYWIGIVESGFSVFASIASILVAEYVRVGRQRAFLRNAFGHYLSPAVIERIIERPETLRLGGERRGISVMFTDLEGFTALAEKLDPSRLAAVLNEYLSAMSEIIFEEGGTIDKYEGDAIIAFWNAPLEQEDHIRRAVNAALRCGDKLRSLRPRLAELTAGSHGFRMRIGVHSGMAVVGNMGSRMRFNYTVLGDTVNLASRLEGANKVFGTSILVSGAVAEAFGLDSMRYVARIAVLGRSGAVDVYEPRVPVGGVHIPDLGAFTEARSLFAKGDFGAAASIFAELAPVDPVSAAYLRKCASLAVERPEPWDGVWVLDSK